ncbi:uncharacterized protein LOC111398123 [Olea europaea var. sylvestris]|uniref:uncharacterized protein LOC111398123 n=1 Tax=Olea europaea var. sylvestris TaxID=158386 RepID=UPI000C1D77F3|nr:uncharacterized protein LOC111398123 [Olea europaea var. sylvestris]
MSALKKCTIDLEDKNKGGIEEYLTKQHSPFTEDVLTKPLPERLKVPQMIAYEGERDPLSHLDKYTLWIELQGTSDAIMCRAFPLALGNKAQRWFRRLHQVSVKNWNDLAFAFLAQVMGAKTRTTSKERLVSIKEGKSESLKSYLSGFNKQSMKVEKIFNDAALTTKLAGLRPRTRFWWSVHMDGPRTYYELLNRDEKYISAEEATSNQDEAKCDPDHSKILLKKKGWIGILSPKAQQNTAEEKRLDRNPQPKRMKDRGERDRPKNKPYKF